MATKRRLEVQDNHHIHTFVAGVAPTVKVVDEKPGPVTWLDKAKGYYKELIVLVGAILVFLNEVTPVLNFLPEQDKRYVTVAIGFIAAVSTFLKRNEKWVDDL